MGLFTLIVVSDGTPAEQVAALRRCLYGAGVSSSDVLVIHADVVQMPRVAGIETNIALRKAYLDAKHRRWKNEVGRFVRLEKVAKTPRAVTVSFCYEDEELPVTLGMPAFLSAFEPAALPGEYLEALSAEAYDSARASLAVEGDAPIGPECFGGSDEGSHYMAQTSAVALKSEQGLTDDEHSQLDTLSDVDVELEPSPIPLGQLEGVAQSQTDRDLLRRIARLTGWIPVVRVVRRDEGSVPAYHITYRYKPQRGEGWQENTHIQDTGRHDERLTLGLRVVLRNINQSAQRDL